MSAVFTLGYIHTSSENHDGLMGRWMSCPTATGLWPRNQYALNLEKRRILRHGVLLITSFDRELRLRRGDNQHLVEPETGCSFSFSASSNPAAFFQQVFRFQPQVLEDSFQMGSEPKVYPTFEQHFTFLTRIILKRRDSIADYI
jgi:hypothetical protein